MSKFWAPARMVFVTVSSTNAFIPVQSTKFNQVASARLCFLIDLEITEKTKNIKITIRSIIILFWSPFYIYIAKWLRSIIIAETDNSVFNVTETFHCWLKPPERHVSVFHWKGLFSKESVVLRQWGRET